MGSIVVSPDCMYSGVHCNVRLSVAHATAYTPNPDERGNGDTARGVGVGGKG